MESSNLNYPVNLNIIYPEKLDRFTSFFRLFMAIPILIVLTLISGPSSDYAASESAKFTYQAGGIIFFATLLLIVFRQKYPKWWFNWNVEFTKFSTRVAAYIFLLRDEYPSTDEEQAVKIDIPYPDAKNDLNRFLPIVKWFLAIPHYIILAFLYVAVVICVIIAWFAILFSAKYPKGIFDFVVGVVRWTIRVSAYAFLLTTDKYPPFTLS